ncbi:hypothetical protein DU475_21465 [Rhodopseudomonas sp. WA056]|uniref:Uncharacterized protein n=1 Tax=Rhodopseudomonas palustris (strain DX-1) TaxID=652103 RepID=E6VD30_RHOPX|nr:hypothetical protein [Rhodopseudomonas sp. WA056]NEW89815.1 hypothetical protein [Rhodopseudomonas sp. WA056]
MTLDQFRDLADVWGGDIERWPAEVRGAARVLAAGDPGAAVLREAAAFDALLAIPPEVAPARAGRVALGVLHRIGAGEAREPWYRRLLQPASLLPAGSLACSALVGMWLAGTLPYQHSQEALAAVDAVFDSSVVTLWSPQ